MNSSTQFQTEGSSGRKLKLYHCTDQSSACLILADKRFIRGQNGFFGGGIYFAENSEDAKRKANKNGVVLSAEVEVGKSLVGDCKLNIDFQTIQKYGCDSLKGTCLKGNEWVVYNNTQTRNIEVLEGMSPSRCTDSECARYGKDHYGDCGKVCERNFCKMFRKKHRAHCKDDNKKILWTCSNE